jgi:hypothetical protein
VELTISPLSFDNPSFHLRTISRSSILPSPSHVQPKIPKHPSLKLAKPEQMVSRLVSQSATKITKIIFSHTLIYTCILLTRYQISTLPKTMSLFYSMIQSWEGLLLDLERSMNSLGQVYLSKLNDDNLVAAKCVDT